MDLDTPLQGGQGGDLVLAADAAHRRQHGRAVALGHKHEARLREPRREAESSGVPPRPHSAEGARKVPRPSLDDNDRALPQHALTPVSKGNSRWNPTSSPNRTTPVIMAL